MVVQQMKTITLAVQPTERVRTQRVAELDLGNFEVVWIIHVLKGFCDDGFSSFDKYNKNIRHSPNSTVKV